MRIELSIQELLARPALGIEADALDRLTDFRSIRAHPCVYCLDRGGCFVYFGGGGGARCDCSFGWGIRIGKIGIGRFSGLRDGCSTHEVAKENEFLFSKPQGRSEKYFSDYDIQIREKKLVIHSKSEKIYLRAVFLCNVVLKQQFI